LSFNGFVTVTPQAAGCPGRPFPQRSEDAFSARKGHPLMQRSMTKVEVKDNKSKEL
jgi:hypothetical protein